MRAPVLTIKRTCAQKIISLALIYDGYPFIAVLPRNRDDCINAESSEQLQRLLIEIPDAYVIYNQHPQALALVEMLVIEPQQILIEIRQEIRGVLGLQARYRNSRANETLELVYQ